MVSLLILSLILLILVTVVVAGAGDVIVAKVQYGQWHRLTEPALPFLIIPTTRTVPMKPQPVGRGAIMPSERLGAAGARADQLLGRSYDEESNGDTVLFRPLTDEPLHVLPGRLEVLAGDNAGEDIRFVGNFGEVPEVILGREAGTSAHTLTLRSPTVSRRHAKLEFAAGVWAITNLSRTNPVVLNDTPLPVEAEGRTLEDGDRVELGEVVLRFHAR